MLSNRDLIVAAYAAFNRRDIDAALALMHPGVDWPNGMEGGRVHGREQVREYWTRQWKQIDPHVEPIGGSEDGDGNLRRPMRPARWVSASPRRGAPEKMVGEFGGVSPR